MNDRELRSGIDVAITAAAPIVVFRTDQGLATGQVVDAWELQAARRALTTLKGLMPGPVLLALLKPQIEEADRRIRDDLARSGGGFQECRVDGTAEGISARALFLWFVAQQKATLIDSSEQTSKAAACSILSSHPEHYARLPYPGAVEGMAGEPIRTRFVRTDRPPSFVASAEDKSFPFRLAARIELEDHTLCKWALYQFRDIEGGLEMVLKLWWPAASPVSLEEQTQHLAVEFRNAVRLALSTSSPSA